MKKEKLTVELEFNEYEIKNIKKEANSIKMNINEYVSFKVNNYMLLELIKYRQMQERIERKLNMKRVKSYDKFIEQKFETNLI